MGTGRYPPGASDEAAHSPTEEQTLASDEDWRVAEQYRTEPVEPADRPVDDGDIVIQQDVPPEPPRKFPPDIGPGLLAALLGVLLVAILVPTALWLASRDDDTATTDTNTFDTGPETLPPTTTPSAPAQRGVPDLVGRPLAEARRLLENGNFRVRVRRVESQRPRGEVLRMAPKPATEVDVRSIVVLTVSSGAERVVVPDVEGLTASEAIDLLRGVGLASETRLVPSDEPEGTVIAQSPAAEEEVAAGTEVVLDVAEAGSTEPPPPTTTEPATVRVPNLVGMRAAAARERLRALGLRPTQRPVQSSRPAGEVVRQSPGAGAEVREGGIVTLRVSTGPATIAVPDVVGLSEAAAIRDLESAGFVVSVVDEPTVEPTEDGFVLRQNPPGGASRRKGSTVTITVARFT
jgi:beta-lactam-binding protein with PASTA domain